MMQKKFKFGFLIPALYAVSIIPCFSLNAETIQFQLRWHHQFQFAGYYAAVEKGFYEKEGLNVIINEGLPGKTPVEEVLSGRAQYGEANSELLYDRLKGKPLIALAAIFQHSPSVLLARKNSGINNPQDLIGRKVMLIGNESDVDLIAMLQNEGINLKRVKIIPSSYDFQDLINQKTDAFNSYITNEPFFLGERHIEYNVINPRNYGIDFYSDIMFTTESELKNNPGRVEKFTRASLEGWKYAMEHPDEIIDLLITKYGVKKSRRHLQYEANAMKNLILPDLVPMGHMNPGRWEHMRETFVKVGMADPESSIDGFIYDPENDTKYKKLLRLVYALGLTAFVGFLTASSLLWMYRKMKLEIIKREEAEQKITKMAFYDQLTELPNRNLLYDRIDTAIKRSERYREKFAVCYLDLDNFKPVNDKYGHQAGDKYLKKFADIVKESLRDSDTVARMGGDEFIVLLERVQTKKDIEFAAENILKAIGKPTEVEGLPFTFHASMGIAVFPDDGSRAETLLVKADQAMYTVKNSSKGKLKFA